MIKFHKVNSLPATLEADSLYFVLNGTYAETYVTNTSGAARSVGNSAMINALIDTKLNAVSTIRQVANIAARNTDKASTTASTMYLVTDATGDTSVSSGAALYFYNKTADSFTKLSEYESMDVVLQWANIQGKPNSAAAAIDAAVGNAHTHTNKATLDKLGESNGKLTISGVAVGNDEWATNAW